jgi:hypothetical protein
MLASCPGQNVCPFWKNYIKMILGTYSFQDLFFPQLLQIFENFIAGFL